MIIADIIIRHRREGTIDEEYGVRGDPRAIVARALIRARGLARQLHGRTRAIVKVHNETERYADCSFDPSGRLISKFYKLPPRFR